MKRKLLSMLLTVAMVATMLTGCGSKEAASGDAEVVEDGDAAEVAESADGAVQVGIVLPTKDEPRWLQDQAQFEKILGDAGFTNQVLFSQGSSATEKTNVETLKVREVRNEEIEKIVTFKKVSYPTSTAYARSVTGHIHETLRNL